MYETFPVPSYNALPVNEKILYKINDDGYCTSIVMDSKDYFHICFNDPYMIRYTTGEIDYKGFLIYGKIKITELKPPD